MYQNFFYDDGKFPLPKDLAHQISLRAAQLARQFAPRGPNNSYRAIRETSQVGKVGIYIPESAYHLIYLNEGIRPFIMYGLEGKVIPIRNPDGSINFRKANNVGGTRIVSRDRKGRIVNSEKKWKHPGTEPLNFIEKALNQAIQEWVDSLNSDDIIGLLQEFPGAVGELFKTFNISNKNFADRSKPKSIRTKTGRKR